MKADWQKLCGALERNPSQSDLKSSHAPVLSQFSIYCSIFTPTVLFLFIPHFSLSTHYLFILNSLTIYFPCLGFFHLCVVTSLFFSLPKKKCWFILPVHSWISFLFSSTLHWSGWAIQLNYSASFSRISVIWESFLFISNSCMEVHQHH